MTNDTHAEHTIAPESPLPLDAPGWQRALHRIADAAWFQNTIIAVILCNAVVIGLETYAAVEDRWAHQLDVLDRVFLGIFVLELAVRFGAAGLRPGRFFRSGWNVFDTIVVAVSFIPGLQGNSTILRLARLLRVTRLLRLMPDLKVLIDGARKAAPPAASLVGLTFLLCYIYAIVGWSIFHDSVPERFGNLSELMLTLFTLLTLEGWNEIFYELREASNLAFVYTFSFILIGTFVVLNLVIGVVITSLDEAYGEKKRGEEGPELSNAIDEVRRSLDALERELSGTPGDPRLMSMAGSPPPGDTPS